MTEKELKDICKKIEQSLSKYTKLQKNKDYTFFIVDIQSRIIIIDSRDIIIGNIWCEDKHIILYNDRYLRPLLMFLKINDYKRISYHNECHYTFNRD
jgi:hypothetical protein